LTKELQRKGHLSQRKFGWEYPKSYFDVFKNFYKAYWSNRPDRLAEVDGFVHVLNDTHFLLVPCIDELDMAIACRIDENQKLPNDRSYIRVRGKRIAELYTGSALGYPCLDVEDVTALEMPELFIKPEINLKEFAGLLFEGWSEIPDRVGEAISLSIVSSPRDALRAGGLTSSLFLDREQKRDFTIAERVVSQIQRKMDPDLLKPWLLELPETIGIFNRNPFEWKYLQGNADAPRKDLIPFLSRPPILNELSVNLFSRSHVPVSPEILQTCMTDHPLILPSNVQKYAYSEDSDPRINNFIISVHMNQTVGSIDILKRWQPHIHEKVEKIRQQYAHVPYVRVVNPDRHGTPESIVHTALPLARSIGQISLTDKAMEDALRLCELSYKEAMEKWEDVTKIEGHPIENLLRASSPEQRRMYYYLKEHPDSSREEIRSALFSNMKTERFNVLFEDAYKRGIIYESLEGRFRAT
jgi:hypothetical protein